MVIDGLTSVADLQTNSDGRIIDGASDISLKDNVIPLEGALEKINQLRGVSFEWKPNAKMGEGTNYGFIAQDVQRVIPDLVKLRARSNHLLKLDYKQIIPWLVEAVKELSSDNSPLLKKNNIVLQTQTISAEDNFIELNFGGTKETALGGGVRVLHAAGLNKNSEIIVDEYGRWIVGPALATNELILPEYTPTSTYDSVGYVGSTVWDDDYTYIKTNKGWKRSNLQSF